MAIVWTVLISLALAPAEVWLLRKLEGGRERDLGFYMVVLSVGILVIGLVAIFIVVSLTSPDWAMVIPFTTLGVPFLWIVIRGLGRTYYPPGTWLSQATDERNGSGRAQDANDAM